MAADWLKLAFDPLEPIAQRPEAPRLLLPAPHNGAGSKYALVFPLSRGWSIVVDVRDASCHLKHLPTGTAAALPNMNHRPQQLHVQYQESGLPACS
jgi:hypothetical protein